MEDLKNVIAYLKKGYVILTQEEEAPHKGVTSINTKYNKYFVNDKGEKAIFKPHTGIVEVVGGVRRLIINEEDVIAYVKL